MKNFFGKNVDKIILGLFLVVVGVGTRLMDLPPNFSPLASIALFSGFYFRKKVVFVLPIAILFLSDLFLGFYQWQVMLSVYLSFVLMICLGQWILKRSNWKVLFASLTGAVAFYLVTNFSVWFFTPWYEKTFEGLMLCYTLALPFFRNTVFGNLFFTFLIFGVYDVMVYFYNNVSIVQCKKSFVSFFRKI